MSETTQRRRAPGMSPEMRREMIIRTAIPLVAEKGTAVTTAEIARAAGIGEATIFRVFTDKAALIDACILEVLKPDTLLAELADIPRDQPLRDRLVEAGGALQANSSRIGAILGVLQHTGHRNLLKRGQSERPAGEDAAQSGGGGEDGGESGKPGDAARSGRAESADLLREALADVLRPDQDVLRLPAERLAMAFGTLMVARLRPLTSEDITVEEAVDLFLNGALAR